MKKINEVMAFWDAFYNAPLIADPTLDYITVSVMRLIVAWAAWRMLKALWRYANVALPPPHTPANVRYWVIWWVWLRLRDKRGLKLGTIGVLCAVLGQIPAGISGALNDTSLYFMLMCSALVVLFITLAREFHALSRKIEHPRETA